mmetsp:Transcript_75567/g.179552  ORF Transcript_75567/g.179552 Transcript_75567/m.179552 type:complete len:209 (-) Transcript_75567:79-705(-)
MAALLRPLAAARPGASRKPGRSKPSPSRELPGRCVASLPPASRRVVGAVWPASSNDRCRAISRLRASRANCSCASIPSAWRCCLLWEPSEGVRFQGYARASALWGAGMLDKLLSLLLALPSSPRLTLPRSLRPRRRKTPRKTEKRPLGCVVDSRDEASRLPSLDDWSGPPSLCLMDAGPRVAACIVAMEACTRWACPRCSRSCAVLHV